MKNLAIIGLGPRGLSALERLLIHLQKTNKNLNIVGFEPSDKPGAGHVWHTNQAESNWVNINERALKDLEGRPEILFDKIKIDTFPSYHEWANFSQNETDADTFPPRIKIGKYLSERYSSLENALKKSSLFKIIKSEITSINFNDNLLTLTSAENKIYKCDAVLITIGHQTTELSDQLKSWNQHIKKSNKALYLFEDPYPVSLFDDLKNQKKKNIGIRGFGLAMIDVMRTLTMNNYGSFKIIDSKNFKTKYVKSKKQDISIVPFSLDGKPMSPKPLNKKIDNWYKPSDVELGNFKIDLERAASGLETVNDISFLIKSISKIATRIFLALDEKAIKHTQNSEEVENSIEKWLNDENYNNSIIQSNNISTYTLIERYIDMALGKRPVSLDFCVGQVWRHCQPILYASLSHSKLDNGIIEDIIKLDDRSKRYSYGPPIESMQQILALVDAEILSLDFVNNPEIETTKSGWQLMNKNGESLTLEAMINSVLDAPKLLEVNTPIIKSLLQNDLIQPLHSKLGIDTKTNGCVISYNAEKNLPIYVLGRLSKGSVIGVDAILECFGKRIEDWAKAFVERL